MDAETNIPGPDAGADQAKTQKETAAVGNSGKVMLENIATMLYYMKNPLNAPETKKFEELSAEVRSEWIKKVMEIIIILDKLNLRIVAKAELEKPVMDDKEQVRILTVLIQNFMKHVKTLNPKLFPCEELAWRIITGRRD